MNDILTEGYNFSISRYIEREGIKFFELAKAQGLEGIVAKKKDGKYYIGKRTREWVKSKLCKTKICTFADINLMRTEWLKI